MEVRESYVINLIPCEADRAILAAIKEYFYLHDFKYTTKRSYSPPHLTVAKLWRPKSWDDFSRALTERLGTQEAIVAPVAQISDEVTRTARHPDGEGWVALVFSDPAIHKLYFSLDNLLNEYECSGSESYIQAIRDIKGDHLSSFDCIANHINMCNHCKPEKVHEARQYILGYAPKVITFDTLVIRLAMSDEEDIRFELVLK